MNDFGLFLGIFLALFVGGAIVSAVFGKVEGFITFILLFLFQGFVSFSFTPIVFESQANVSFVPQINIGMVCALMILIFVSNKNIKIGSASYLLGTALLYVPILFSLM